MLTKLQTKIFELPLEWIYKIFGTLAILLIAALMWYGRPGHEYATDNHGVLMNLLVVMFSLLVMETLSSAKATIAVRRADGKRILSFHQLLSAYLSRYVQAADAMIRPTDSFLPNSTFNREIKEFALPDIINMYNDSSNEFVPSGTKCYTVYFNAAIALGNAISGGLAHLSSSQHPEISTTLIKVATNTNSLDMQMLQQYFLEKERSILGTTPMGDIDKAMLSEMCLNNSNQTVDLNNQNLSAYAKTYEMLMENIRLIEEYKSEIATITKRHKH